MPSPTSRTYVTLISHNSSQKKKAVTAIAIHFTKWLQLHQRSYFARVATATGEALPKEGLRRWHCGRWTHFPRPQHRKFYQNRDQRGEDLHDVGQEPVLVDYSRARPQLSLPNLKTNRCCSLVTLSDSDVFSPFFGMEGVS
jgi:hypothetical protein